jgi:hypothetical protein
MSCSVVEWNTIDGNSRLERWIEQRTGGRVCGLRVENHAGQWIIHGRTGSYYVRQLALAAVLELLEPEQLEQVELDIEVAPSSIRSTDRSAPVSHSD